MSLTSKTIPSMIGGVSQQSDLVRSPDQMQDQTNGWSDIAMGVSKRPPTQLVAKLMANAPTNAFVHPINRDISEQYLAIIADGVIRVFDVVTGAECPVEAPSGWSYLATATDYASDFDAVTVADYTFVTNRKVTCALKPVGSDTTADDTYQLWLNKTYGVDANGVEFGPGVAYQYRPNPVYGYLSGTVQRFDKLPPTPSEGMIYQVRGDDTSDFISYYVVYRSGAWEECLKPGMANAIDAKTMPHALISKGDGTFLFAPFSWAPRRVGDENNNPNPGFIG